MTDKVAFRDSIALQPKSLEDGRKAVLTRLDQVDLAPLRQGTVALTGIGASLYAALAAAPHFRSRGIRAFAVAATDLYEPVDAADAYSELSASGRSVEPATAMERRRGAATFGIAKAADTPLAGAVRTMIATASGADGSPNTTSYVGSLQALGLIADRVGRTPSGADWSRLPEAVAEQLDASVPAVRRAAELLHARVAIDCVGAGPAHGTAGYIALLLREAVRVAAQSWDTLNFLHGPMEPNDGRSGVLLFGSGRELQLAQDLPEFGIPTVLVTDRVDIGEKKNLVVIPVPSVGGGLPDAILQALPGQLLLADLMEAAGLPQCNFRYRQTDTKLTDAVRTP